MSERREASGGRLALTTRSLHGARAVPLGLGGHARKLARSVYSNSVTSTLREEIISGRLAGGTPLVEQSLAQELDVSRTPVRSALSVLEGEGLVTTLGNGRMIVAGFGHDDLADLLSVRYELESTAVDWAVARRADTQPTIEIFEEMAAERASTQRLIDLDIDFHRALLTASGSRFLLQAWMAIAPVIHTVITLGNRELEARDPAGNFERIIRSHSEIVDPLKAGDAALATARLKEQFRLTASMFDRYLGQEQEPRERRTRS